MTTRRFLISASLARLLRLHLGSTRGAHGYFPPQPDRIHFIDLEPGRWEMVIVPVENDSRGPEERLAITRRHAEALLDLCAAKLGYEQTWVLIDDGREVRLDHFIAGSGTVDVLTLEFHEDRQSDSFDVPVWFGPEVTDNPAYEPHVLAFAEMPQSKAPLTEEALDAVLTILIEQHGLGQQTLGHDPEERTRNAFRQLATVVEQFRGRPPLH